MPCAVCHQPSKRSSPICTPWIHEYRTRTTDHGLVQKLENEPVDGLEGYDFVSQIRTIDEGESTLPNGKELANGADLPQSGDGGAACFGRCVYQYRHEMSARERAWVKKIQEEDRLMEKDMDEIEDDTVAIEQAQAAVAQSIESLSREMDISNARIERAEKLIVGMSTSAKAGRMSASERLKEKGAAMKRTTAELAASRKSARADCSSPVSAIVPDDPDSTTPSHVVKYERESFGEEPRSVQSTPTKKSMEDAVMANEWTSEWNDTCEWGYHNSTGPTK
eukprot:CAMPEP_0198125726 /NCGR_PEP_ID=MMETSP1442-20131203/43235_1 /TAXON_ID= /ORGANISM="Craspedostauros australis, Strain CCMP3328" /LENGTH=278 /DNA_ID=CAMNT_0043785383 /DNA_START=740 /DNA_END=1577 /DNA_ORIENTATION=-